MRPVAIALSQAFKSLFHPKILSMIIWPMLIATLLWGGIAFYFWHDWVSNLTQFVSQSSIQSYIKEFNLSWLAGYLISFMIFLLLIPVAYLTALLITSIFAMPIMVSHIAKNHYPDLELKQGGSISGSVYNGLIAITIYLVLWVITLPLWFFMPFSAIVPIFLTAYLNQRLFRYDSLAEHASAEEFRQIIERSGSKFYLLGGILALLQFIPVLQFFTPIYIGLAFIHFSLGELAELRKNG